MKSNDKKKILYVITKSNFGGAQRYVYDLATQIPSDKFDIKVLLGGGEILKRKLDTAGISTISLPRFKRNINILNDVSSFFTLIKIFKEEKPDIIHLNSSKAGFMGTLAGRVARVPKIIFTAHGWAFNEDRNWFSKLIFLKIHWVTILLSHTTIAVSQQTKKQVSHLPFIKNKIEVVYNGISDNRLLNQNEARKKFLQETNNNSIWVGTISELHKNKGLTFAIKAISLLKNNYPYILFFIIGGGEEEENLKKLIEKLGLLKNIFLVGKIEDASKLLPAFDIFLLSSITEALPYVLLEAGSAQLPTVATEVGGIPEIITSGETGLLVPSRSPKAIAEALKKLINNRNEARTLGVKLQQKVLKKFSLNQMVEKTSLLYTK